MSLRKAVENAEWGHRGNSSGVGWYGEGEKRGTSTLAGLGGPVQSAEEPGQSQAEARLSGLALPFFLLLKIKEYVIHFFKHQK